MKIRLDIKEIDEIAYEGFDMFMLGGAVGFAVMLIVSFAVIFYLSKPNKFFNRWTFIVLFFSAIYGFLMGGVINEDRGLRARMDSDLIPLTKTYFPTFQLYVGSKSFFFIKEVNIKKEMANYVDMIDFSYQGGGDLRDKIVGEMRVMFGPMIIENTFWSVIEQQMEDSSEESAFKAVAKYNPLYDKPAFWERVGVKMSDRIFRHYSTFYIYFTSIYLLIILTLLIIMRRKKR